MATRTFTKDSATQLENELQWLITGGYLSGQQVATLKQMLESGVAKSIDFDLLSAAETRWDGEIRINFARAGVKAIAVVSGLLQSHMPDEIHFVTEKQLRLWWD